MLASITSLCCRVASFMIDLNWQINNETFEVMLPRLGKRPENSKIGQIGGVLHKLKRGWDIRNYLKNNNAHLNIYALLVAGKKSTSSLHKLRQRWWEFLNSKTNINAYLSISLFPFNNVYALSLRQKKYIIATQKYCQDDEIKEMIVFEF